MDATRPSRKVEQVLDAILDLNSIEWNLLKGGTKGVYDKWVAHPKETKANLRVKLAKLAPGGVFPKHKHPFPQIFIFLEGEGELEFAGETLTARPGVVARMLQGEEHEVRNNGSADLVLFEISIVDPRDGL